MASSLNLESDKTSQEMEIETVGDFRTCSLCKSHGSTRKGSENPLHSWLTMDTRNREKHLKHMKICILAPALFGKRMNYSSKNIRWLRHLSLVPRPSVDRTSCLGLCLSDRLIELVEFAEEIVDTVLSCLGSDEFLHNSYHTYKELKDCSIIEEALSVGKRSEFVSLMSNSFNSDHHVLDKQGIQLFSLTVLHQAIKYVCQACKPRDCLTKFEEEMAMKEPLCTELRLKGNNHFVEGDYQMAVAFYSRAIKLSPFNPLLYGNRAQSYLKLKKLRQALSDAKRAVYLCPDWEKGHYRFAQAYFELGFPEKAMAANSLAQKCCSSTLNLLCQAGAFKREMEESAVGSKTQCCSSSAEQTADSSHHHQASGNPCSSRTKVGSKRNWKIANEKSVVDAIASALTLPAEKGTSRHLRNLEDHLSSDEEDNFDSRSNKDEDSVCELSDDDSIPPLTYDSSDDCSDDDDDDSLNGNKLFPGDSVMSSLPSLASLSDSDTESDDSLESDGQLAEGSFAEDLRCYDPECLVCNDDNDDNDVDDDDDDFDVESDDDDDDDDGDDDYDDEDDEHDSDSDEDDDDEDLLRSLLLPPLLNGEVNSFTGLVLGVLHGFFTAHPEMMNEGSPPALPEVIESLPKVKLTNEQVALNLSCAICQCDYEQDEAVLELPCSHIFHPTCVTTWLKMHATCPTCRDVLPH